MDFEVRQSAVFAAWLRRLGDPVLRARIGARIRRLELGNLGDARSVGGGVSELRMHFGPGYRVYFTRQGAALLLLLCGGDKSSQVRDIEAAKQLAAQARE